MLMGELSSWTVILLYQMRTGENADCEKRRPDRSINRDKSRDQFNSQFSCCLFAHSLMRCTFDHRESQSGENVVKAISRKIEITFHFYDDMSEWNNCFTAMLRHSPSAVKRATKTPRSWGADRALLHPKTNACRAMFFRSDCIYFDYTFISTLLCFSRSLSLSLALVFSSGAAPIELFFISLSLVSGTKP